MEIREVDPADEAALYRWWQAVDASMADRPFPQLNPGWETTRETMTRPHGEFAQTLLAAYDGDEVVGAAHRVLPVHDNLSMSYADIQVPPQHRRRGIGSALLADVEARARADGRSYVLVEVLATEGQAKSGESPGAAFAAAHGYPVANREAIKVLDLRDHPDWAPLASRVEERLGGYRVVEWREHTPPEHAQAVCDALNQFVGMVPLGDIALEDTSFDPERLRKNEERGDAMGRRRFCAVAFSPAGELVGYTDVFVSPGVERHADVGITMVLPGHRGHALGLAMKLATHAALQVAVPTCELVATSNADANEHMNAVNEQMGYRLVEQLLEVQKKL